MLLGTLFAILALVVIPMRSPLDARLYQSGAKILMTPSSASNLVSVSLGPGAANGKEMTPTSVQAWFADESTLRDLLTSEELLDRVIATLKLKETWSTLKNSIKVEGIRQDIATKTNLYRVSAMATDPEQSRKLASTLVDEFSRYVQDLSAREYSSYRRFLEELAAEAEGKVKKAESVLVALKKDDGPDEGGQETRQAMLLRDNLKLEEGKLRAQLKALQDFKAGNGGAPPWVIVEQKSPSLGGLESDLAQNKLRLLEMSTLFTPQTDIVIEQKNKIAKIQQVYDREMASYVSSLVIEKTTALQQAQAEQRAAAAHLDALFKRQLTVDDRLNRAKAERQLTMWQENFLSLTRQLYQARVLEQASRRQGSIAVLERPQAGVEVLASGKGAVNPLLRFILGLPFCFLFGIGLALAVDYMFASMKIQPRIEEALGLPVIALIPPRNREITERWDRMKLGEEAAQEMVADKAV